jgi:hypothetical protein
MNRLLASDIMLRCQWWEPTSYPKRLFPGKIAQEKLIKQSSIPYSIVHATQFFEFLKTLPILCLTAKRCDCHLYFFQTDSRRRGRQRCGQGCGRPPVNSVVDIAGPEQFRLEELVRRHLTSLKDPRKIICDPNAPYAGAKVSEKHFFRAMAHDSTRPVSKLESLIPQHKRLIEDRLCAEEQLVRH